MARLSDRIECLSPLFEVLRSSIDMPFKFSINIYVTQSMTPSETSRPLVEKTTSMNEKGMAEDDLEALTPSLPALTCHSSRITEEGNSRDTISTCSVPSPLYAVHDGRPKIPTIVRSFGAEAEGESVAVTGT
ncbi:hypothetical protein QFC19_003638 [Naganishia cerealis]|uniref:Uncharacterized protein n=1 Tax=Naganishia cerealis TaxID=610337 RepID=A0ACC2W161_9TREE|nr:hypothetical protein QFC19_003638 [Naganishia cerealis]